MLLAVLAAFISQSFASDLPPEVARSVVQLKGKSACGTGFLMGRSEVLTNHHVASMLCDERRCEKVEFLQSETAGAKPAKVFQADLTLVHSIPSLDLALLRWEGPSPLLDSVLGSTEPVKPGDPIRTLGYPECGPLELSDGEVSFADSALIRSTAKIIYGSSGSPFLDRDFKVVGIVSQLDHGLGNRILSLSHLLLGNSTRLPARGAPLAKVSLLLSSDPMQSLLAESEILNHRFEETILSPHANPSFRIRLEFPGMIESLLRRGAMIGSECPETYRILFQSSAVDPEDPFALPPIGNPGREPPPCRALLFAAQKSMIVSQMDDGMPWNDRSEAVDRLVRALARQSGWSDAERSELEDWLKRIAQGPPAPFFTLLTGMSGGMALSFFLSGTVFSWAWRKGGKRGIHVRLTLALLLSFLPLLAFVAALFSLF